VAVLAFTSLAVQNYFADGMVDEIITMLGQVPTLMIAGRSSSFGLKDSKRSLPEIAQILGVAYLVEGSVQLQGNEVRINVRLLDSKTGFETWENRYKGTIDDVFALQERVAGDVLQGLSEILGLTLAAPKINEITANRQA
jgi:TolB-like protein